MARRPDPSPLTRHRRRHLLLAVLAERPEMAPEWLWTAIGDSANEDLVARLDRLAYDLMTIHGPYEQQLATWLAAIVAREPACAKALEFLAWTESVGDGARPLAIAVIQETLGRSGLEEDEWARMLGNLSTS